MEQVASLIGRHPNAQRVYLSNDMLGMEPLLEMVLQRLRSGPLYLCPPTLHKQVCGGLLAEKRWCVVRGRGGIRQVRCTRGRHAPHCRHHPS